MAGRSLIVGRFPLGEPDFRTKPGKRGGVSAWRLSAVADGATGAPPPALGDPSTPWALQPDGGPSSSSTRPSHISSAEGIPGGGGAGYFVLVRDGTGFTAWPVAAWHTFRPPRAHAVPTLEEAEAAMERRARGLQALPGTSRLAALVGRAAEDDRRAGRGGDDDEVKREPGEDEDEEEEAGRRRPFARTAAARPAGPSAPSTAAAVGDVRAGRPVGADPGAEDWEHEEDRADDDLDMGEDGEGEDGGGGVMAVGGGRAGAAAVKRGARRPGSLSPSEDEDEDDGYGSGRPRLTGAGAELKRILASTGLGDEDSEEEEAAAAAAAAAKRKAAAAAAAAAPAGPSSRARTPLSDDDDEDEDDGDDDEDLDAMAEAYKPAVIARLASERGAPPPPPAAAGPVTTTAPPSRSASPAGGGAGTKRKAGTPGSADAAKKAKGAGGPPPAASGPPSDAELVAALRVNGPMPSSALTAMFKPRLTSPDARKEFTAAVKRVARLEDRGGAKVIVLKE